MHRLQDKIESAKKLRAERAGLQGSASYAGAPKTGIVMNGTGVAKEHVNCPLFKHINCPVLKYGISIDLEYLMRPTKWLQETRLMGAQQDLTNRYSWVYGNRLARWNKSHPTHFRKTDFRNPITVWSLVRFPNPVTEKSCAGHW